jgi:hypothetical protein
MGYYDTKAGRETARGLEWRGDRKMICSNCGTAFQGKSWMTLCRGCYQAEALKNPNRAEVIELHAERGRTDMKCERCQIETGIRRFCTPCQKAIFTEFYAAQEAA